MRGVVLVVVAACGRIGFDAHGDASNAPRPCEYKAISAGGGHTCAIDHAGAVWCWGENTSGQALPGAEEYLFTARHVPLATAALDVRAGRTFSCARLEDLSVWCWGDNDQGGLGDGTTTGTGPVQAAIGDSALELQVGTNQACVVRASDRSIVCWGANAKFALGNTGPAIQPATVIANTAGTQILGQIHHGGCAVSAANEAMCWGNNDDRVLGATGVDRATLGPVPGLSAARYVAKAGRFACAVEQSGEVRCWGSGIDGRLGNGTFVDAIGASGVVTSNALEVGLAPLNGFALRADGTVAGWGNVIIDGEHETRATARISALTGVTQLSVGHDHTCAIANGIPVCWGSNEAAELGRGTTSNADVPRPVDIGVVVEEVSIAFKTVCARASGRLFCWGGNQNGNLGDGTQKNSQVPVEVATGLATVEGFEVGWRHVCAWGGGTVRCWGDNENGQLGNGIATGVRTGSPPVTANIAGATDVTTGLSHTCAIVGANVQCWGLNGLGQLGDGTNMGSLTPRTVLNVASPTHIAGQFQSTCAIDGGGAVHCWGHNDKGQLGDNTTTDRSTPFSPALPRPATRLEMGKHTCALLDDGTVYCWGQNHLGQLGTGDLMNRGTPTLFPVPGMAVDIAIGQHSTCARLMTGAMWCSGSLSITSTATPVEVPALAGASKLALEYSSGCVVVNGSISCWGAHNFLGDGDTSPWQPQPVTACP